MHDGQSHTPTKKQRLQVNYRSLIMATDLANRMALPAPMVSRQEVPG